jgi:hypothetical protein
MGGRIFMVQAQKLLRLECTFAPDVSPQPPQNIAVQLSIQPLSWRNKFRFHDAFSVKRNKPTFIWHRFDLVKPRWIAVNLPSSAA